MNNELLEVLRESFNLYITNGARSNKKLIPLHGRISFDLEHKLNELKTNNDTYKCFSFNPKNGIEKAINGRYMDKAVDITIEKNNEIIGGVAVKFVMSNFKQNKNNYFENMLGETANIRTNNYPYYQIFITTDVLPYYDKNGFIKKWENVSVNDLQKYLILSSDDNQLFYHTPNKIFLGLINIPSPNVRNKWEYKEYFEENPDFNISYSQLDLENQYGGNLIYNDYEDFITKISHHLLSL